MGLRWRYRAAIGPIPSIRGAVLTEVDWILTVCSEVRPKESVTASEFRF